jgi:release factor glutamine methyltransferase
MAATVADASVRGALGEAAARLAEVGIETARLDAELLVAHVIGVSRTWLAGHPSASLQADQREALASLVARRERREPLPYLLGRWEFFGLSLRVTPAVLIPRPETEGLVEELGRRLPTRARVLDVGTGSGCIALGLARARADVDVVGIDDSDEAIAVASENAIETGLQPRVRFQTMAFPAPVALSGERFDAVVSNPPYIPAPMLADLPPEVRDYEPRAALEGGEDGLRFHELLLRHAGDILCPGGLLAVEVMAGQAEAVQALARRLGGWGKEAVTPDLAGILRVVVWRREGAAP